MSRMAARWVNVEAIGSYFESLSDPRHTRNRKHLLVDIVVIAVCGMVCGCDGPTAIHRWAANRRGWLGQFLALPHGIPSRDCIRRLLMALKPEAFQKCFEDWVAHAIRADAGGPDRLVAIDGKTCRGSHDAAHGLGLAGWVRNRHDGNVEAMVQGEASAVERFIALAHDGPPSAVVERVEATETKCDGSLSTFSQAATA